MSVRLLLSLTLLFCLTSPTLSTATDPDPTPAVKRELNAAETEHALQLLAEELTKNLDAIHTWQGTCLFQNQVRLTDPRITKDSKWQTTEGQYTFWLDEIHDRLRVNYHKTKKPDEFNLLTPQTPIKVVHPTNTQWIVQGLDVWELGEERFGSVKGFPEGILIPGSKGRVLFRKLRYESEHNGLFFDPRELVGNGSHTFARTCRMYADALSGKPGTEENSKVTKRIMITELTPDSNHRQYLVKIDYNSPEIEAAPIRSETTYDSRFGFNAIKYEQFRGSRLIHKRTFLYNRVGDIFLPHEVDIVRFSSRLADQTEIDLRQNFKLVESKLNQPLDPNQFEIKSLELKPGERIVDQIRGKAFVQYEGRLVPASQFPLLIK